jgi:hypothetical protein
MEIGSRRILTEHATSEWALEQFRELLAFDHPYQSLLHDREAFLKMWRTKL